MLEVAVTFAQLLASIARHVPYLWADERAAFEPCPSEEAVRRIAARMQVRLPGSRA